MSQRPTFRSAVALVCFSLSARWRLLGGLALAATLCGFAWGFWRAEATIIVNLNLREGVMGYQQTLVRLLQSEPFQAEVARASGLGMTSAQVSTLLQTEFAPAERTIRVRVGGRT